MGMIRTYRTIMGVQTAIACNSFIYHFRKIPLIGKLLKESLYSEGDMKDIVKAVAVVLGAVKSLFYSAAYLAVFFFVPYLYADRIELDVTMNAYKDMSIVIFFFMNMLLGGLFQHKIVESQSDTSMILLRFLKLNTKHYFISQAIVNYIRKPIIMFFPMLIAGNIVGIGVLQIVTLLIGLICIRLLIDGLELFPFNIAIKKKTWIFITKYLICTFLCIAGAYVQFFFKPLRIFETGFAPYLISPLAIPAYIFLAALGILLIKVLANYDEMGKRELEELKSVNEIKENVNANVMVLDEKELNMKINERLARKSGYAYLDTMFIQRHRKLFFKRILRTSLIVFIAPVIIGIGSLLFTSLRDAMPLKYAIENLGTWFFVIYLVSFRDNYTTALFNNIDKYLLHFRWYRKPEDIIKNYFIRLKSSFLLNSTITGSLALGMVIGGTLSGVKLTSMLIFVLIIGVLTLFYSIHYLTIYYLLQPYTDQSKVKSPIYSFFNAMIYILSYFFMQLRNVPGWVFALICGTVLIYLAASILMLKKRAPKSFKRNE